MLFPFTIEFFTTTKKLSKVSAIAVFSSPVRTAISFTISDLVIISLLSKIIIFDYCVVEFESLFAKLIEHYRINARFLPWRKTQDPYQIWVSEVILQQTKVLQGLDYFMTFLRYFPDVKALAKAKEDEVLKVWQGLGYYSRALNMHSAAKQIQHDFRGGFPDKYDDIRKLKGVGDYTAAAIASISFNLPHAAVDGNVKRVASRIFGIKTSIQSPATVKQITSLLNQAIVHYKPGEFNQAMMELGALICTPRNPDCANCPMQDHCYAFLHKQQAALPVQDAKRKPTNVALDYVFLEFQGKTWIVKRNKESIWKGLFEFPAMEGAADGETPPQWALNLLDDKGVATVSGKRSYTHKLTHRTIFARFWHLSGKPSNIVRENKSYLEIKTTELGSYPVHRLMHRYLSDSGLI
jgi:A/G-specific adenine glycosylase